jgi:hypothetical protein
MVTNPGNHYLSIFLGRKNRGTCAAKRHASHAGHLKDDSVREVGCSGRLGVVLVNGRLAGLDMAIEQRAELVRIPVFSRQPTSLKPGVNGNVSERALEATLDARV